MMVRTSAKHPTTFHSLFQTGWFHSKLTDVVVRRLKKSSSSIGDGSANLVLSDGCRNPAYKVI